MFGAFQLQRAGFRQQKTSIILIVLTAGQAPDFRDPELNRQAAAYQQVWIHEMQAKLARLCRFTSSFPIGPCVRKSVASPK
jgi:hypothetical protein